MEAVWGQENLNSPPVRKLPFSALKTFSPDVVHSLVLGTQPGRRGGIGGCYEALLAASRLDRSSQGSGTESLGVKIVGKMKTSLTV